MGAWKGQIDVLQQALPAQMRGMVCFEFAIPRVGKRADNILLVGDLVVVLEFKVGATSFDAAARMQAMDYALDLRNFHEASHVGTIVPVLVATQAPNHASEFGQPYEGVYPVLLANAQNLATLLRKLCALAGVGHMPYTQWLQSAYRPTPTILEASQALYQGHGVADITHSEAGADNLGATTRLLNSVIDEARQQGQKVMVLISGVPGAGKTLAGLNLICQRRQSQHGHEARGVFLSGNGPLVTVLQEALARDDVARATDRGESLSKSDAHRKTVAFIQNIHHFRDAYLVDAGAPDDRLVVFDEAQRA